MDWLGILGCITGVTALTIQYLQYMHAKPRLRVEIKPECFVSDMPEFHVQDTEDPSRGHIRPATYVVLTNVGQMSGVVMRMSIAAYKYKWHQLLINKLVPFYKKSGGSYSSDKPFIKETRPTPFILDSGHAWIGVADTDNFRDAVKNYPYVYLEIKPSYTNKTIRKRIKLAQYELNNDDQRKET